MKKGFIAAMLVCILSVVLSTAACAEWKPTSTVSIIVPAGAGGDTDITARVFAQYAKKYSNADFIVVNVNAAAGSVASNQVLASAPDGHTFLCGHLLVNVANIAGITDFNYTAFKLGPTFAMNPVHQLYVKTGRFKDLNDFIAQAKANPGKLTAATEVGALTYYLLLAFENVAGINLSLVDVGSTSDKITAMLGGMIDVMPATYINTRDYLEAGQFTMLGAPNAERYELLKDYPTFKEQGIDLVFPDLTYSFYFPAGTPDEVIAWYEDIVQKIVNDPEAQETLAKIPEMPYYLSAADSAKNEEWVYNTLKEIASKIDK